MGNKKRILALGIAALLAATSAGSTAVFAEAAQAITIEG